MLEKVKNAKIGDIIPIYEAIEGIDAEEFFIKLSNYGRNKNAVLLENKGQETIGSADPCLKVAGKGEDFEIKALNNSGRKFLQFLKGDFKFCDKVEYGKNAIKGKLKPARRNVNEEQRLRLKSHADILRAVAFKFKPTEKPFMLYSGLFGMISYDFIDQFESLPKNAQDNLNDADYEFYFLDNLFVIDKENRVFIVANALVMDDKKEKLYNECLKTIEGYKKALKKKLPKARKYKKKNFQQATDTEKEEFASVVNKIKRHIQEGYILRASVSRGITANYNAEPFEIYRQLKLHNQGHAFYINGENGILLGSSPNENLEVKGDERKTIRIKVMGAENQRGMASEGIDNDLDNKYEVELKADNNEMQRHFMSIDMARNEIARVSEKGSRFADNLYNVEKDSERQYLVSDVKGILKHDLDALHACIATLNMHAGIPKTTAARLLRQHEKARRGFYSGSVCCLTPNGDFKSNIVTRAMKLKNNKAYFRAESGVYGHIRENIEEAEDKAKICISAIKGAGGLK